MIAFMIMICDRGGFRGQGASAPFKNYYVTATINSMKKLILANDNRIC